MSMSMKRAEELVSQCGGCGGGEERFLLHNVRHKGSYRRLCTNCVLRNHEGLFCPLCFHVYQEALLPQQRLLCLKCPSIAHLSCVPSSSPSFLCPSCSSPSFSFFDLPDRLLDRDAARALVAAAKIAAVSMAKAAALARAEAEKRVKEAALAKKRAREALERLAYLAAKDIRDDDDDDDDVFKERSGKP